MPAQAGGQRLSSCLGQGSRYKATVKRHTSRRAGFCNPTGPYSQMNNIGQQERGAGDLGRGMDGGNNSLLKAWERLARISECYSCPSVGGGACG